MKWTQKILMTGIIAAGIFLTSGCEYSSESKNLPSKSQATA